MSATATKNPEVKTPEVKTDGISAFTRAGADSLKENITIHSDSGVAIAGVTYMSLTGGKVTEDEIKRVEESRRDVLQVAVLGHGEVAIEAFKKNPDLASSELVLKDPAGNLIKSVIHRTKLTGAPGGEKTDKFGVATASIELRSERKTGELGNIRAHLSARATKALASK